MFAGKHSLCSVYILAVVLLSAWLLTEGFAVTSGDGYIQRQQDTWRLGTGQVELILTFEQGSLLVRELTNKSAGTSLIPAGQPQPDFSFALGEVEARVTSASGDWRLVGAQESVLSQGELQLVITLERSPLQVVKTWIVFPNTGLIRQWITVTNTGGQPVQVRDPSFLKVAGKVATPDALDFYWMTGAENYGGSWELREEQLKVGATRKFDSFDPMDAKPTKPLGDGVNCYVMQNDKQVFPAAGYLYTADGMDNQPYDFWVDVQQGDKLAFLTNMKTNFGYDTTYFDPTLTYEDGETHRASAEFSDQQGAGGWNYQYLEKGQWVDLVYYPQPKQWRKAIDNPTGTPFVGVSDQHPDGGQDAARVWTAPKSGRVHILGHVCNTGNWAGADPNYHFRMGTASYAPWYALTNGKSGLVIGWDYFGHWTSGFDLAPDGLVTSELRVAEYNKTLAPGESLTTPMAFCCVYTGDLDEAGNALLDWQYGYLWDYARPEWFPAIRMLGYWMKGTHWNLGWLGGQPEWDSCMNKVFRTADFMRYVGGDVYHRDWGWWDKAGDWNGPDWRTANEYLAENDMGLLIYAFLYTVEHDSKVAQEHPEWLCDDGATLDMSLPEVVEFMKGQLDDFYARWGAFEWRNDSCPMSRRGKDDTVLLRQDAGLRKVIQDFLDKHPDCGFQGVNGGGNLAGYDYIRLGAGFQFSDGAVGILGNYWASQLLPPDKINNMPDIWDPARFENATWRGLLANNFDLTGDTWDPAKLEGLRLVCDIYHYLQTQGLVGRWVKVYRPRVEGDDETMYFQRLSQDRQRGILITKHLVEGPITLWPKGLLADRPYFVSYQDGSGPEETRTGADLMAKGLYLAKVAPGELIYLNVPLHPGSKLDTTAPSAPLELLKARAEYLGYPGIELNWEAASDDNWLSYYEVWRDGELIDKVSKGTFYFDHSAGAELAAVYSVRTVDGAGNTSELVQATGPSAARCHIVDDAATRALTYTGNWTRELNLQPAYKGTVSWADAAGASVEWTFEGSRIIWITKLGADCGLAEVSLDGGAPEQVNTYTADDVWGIGLWQKELAPGRHTIRVEILGEREARSKHTRVYLDGFRAEP